MGGEATGEADQREGAGAGKQLTVGVVACILALQTHQQSDGNSHPQPGEEFGDLDGGRAFHELVGADGIEPPTSSL